MKTSYEVHLNGKTYYLSGDSVTLQDGVLYIMRGESVVAMFRTWDAFLQKGDGQWATP